MRVEGAIRVFLVDDHEVVRLGVHSLLQGESDMEVVGEARTVAEAVEGLRRTRPDVCVLDLKLPDGTGIDVCRQIRETHPSVRCLILTGHAGEDAMTAALAAGAAGYVLKQIEGGSLVRGVRMVARGLSLFDEAVAARMIQQAQLRRHASGALAELTPQQRRILFLVAEGLTNRQIAAQLHLAEKTVKNHITGLLARLGVEHRTQAAMLVARLHGAGSQSAEPRSGAPALTS